MAKRPITASIEEPLQANQNIPQKEQFMAKNQEQVL
jgi:hypothetical protein